jgi:hypothetical protein
MTNTEQKGMEPVVEKNADKKKMFLQALFNNAGFIKRACDGLIRTAGITMKSLRKK